MTQLEFYSEESLDKYLKTLSDLHIDDIKESIGSWCKIDYFKGLGSHDKKSLHDLGTRFEENLICYKNSTLTKEIVEILYNKDTNVRKEFLKEVYEKNDVKVINKTVTIANHLINETRFFHLLKITRALPSYIDGQIVSHRKILYYCINFWDGKVTPVAKLGGDIKSQLQYHHGEISLYNTIINMTQNFKGANPIRFLEDNSNFGSIKKGKQSKIQPRYVRNHRSNILRLVFPLDDLPLLDYCYDDGIRVEPKFLIPIIPMSILMNWIAPATGWASKIWCRNIKVVIKYLKNKIKDESYNVERDYFWGKAYVDTIKVNPNKKVKSAEYDEAIYKINGDKISVSELPTGIYVNPFIENMEEKHNIKVIDNSTKDQMSLEFKSNDIKLVPYQMAINIMSHLNYLDEHNNVKSYDVYQDVIDDYFKVRKKYYELRLQRLKDILEIKILKLENIIRFLSEWNKLGITNSTEKDEVIEILNQNNFIKIDISSLGDFIKDVKSFALKHGKPSYKYLTSLAISSLTPKKLLVYKDELDKLVMKKKELDLETWKTLWNKDLDKLIPYL